MRIWADKVVEYVVEVFRMVVDRIHFASCRSESMV